MIRVINAVGSTCLGLLMASAVQAADLSGNTGPRHEVRGGVMYHDTMNRESGVDLNVEYLSRFAAFDLFVPVVQWRATFRPHVGGSLNTAGHTSFVYGGYSLTLDLTDRIFVEGSFGGMVHNGVHVSADRSRLSLGCNVMFRESASVGFRINDQINVSAMVEHGSNAGLCEANNGITNAGVRVGYTF
ncbi:acyloxyacyl hydrolase [Labrenzia sp. PHM005]|uniref:acyloxyacyl hydrolase n=1 Tax=Labrenzia sp. PHM005 TaxID=2590016 RepID=UPI001FFDC4AC|nr:acyloxyacyl hydrolase [Labrenzia sp. PHM005]